MLIRRKHWLLAALLLCCAAGVDAQQMRRPLLRWRPVPGAAAYQVELRYPRGRTFYTGRTTWTWMYVYLQPGYYYLRVSVVNRFQRIESSSAWTPLVVRTAPWPVLDKVVPPDLGLRSQTNVRITVYGRKFKNTTRVELSGSGRTWTPEKQQVKYSRRDGWFLEVDLDAGRLRPGAYRLRLETPVKIFSKETKPLFVRRDGVAGLRGLEVMLGGGWAWPAGKWGDAVASAPFIQASAEFRLSGIRPLSRIPVVNLLRGGIHFQTGRFGELSGNVARSELDQWLLVPYLGVDFRLHARWSLLLRGGFGWAFSSLHSETVSGTVDADSVDLLVRGSLAVRYDLNWWLFTEAGIGWNHLFMLGSAMNNLQAEIRFGCRL